MVSPSQAVEILAALLTLSGMVYHVLALLAARSFRLSQATPKHSETGARFAPPVSILKPLKGLDPRMYAGFVSHCSQQYPAPFEILFGITSLEDPVVGLVGRLRVEYPDVAIRVMG